MYTPLRVLILEDQAADAELILDELRQFGFELDWQRVESQEDFRANLRADLDVILADYSLPQFTAVQALDELHQVGLDIPFIVVTGSISEEVAVHCLKQGAADYLLKDRLARLGPAVVNALEDKRRHAEKQQAEEALRESERFARSTLDGLAAHIAILDETGTILAVNRSWRAFAEANPPVTTNVFEGANYLGVCDRAVGTASEGAAEFSAAIRAVLKGERESFEMEYPCPSPTEQRWFVARVTRFPGAGPVRVVVAHENITRMKQAELKLAEERNLLRTLIDNLPDRVYAKDLEGRFILKNLVDTRQMGAASTDEVIGKTDFDYYPPELATQYYTDDMAVLQSGQPMINHEEPATTADGGKGWMLTSKVPVYDNEGKVIGLVGIGRDITERKLTEKGLIQRSKEIDVLYQASQQLSRTLDLNEIYQIAYQVISEIMDCDTLFISSFNEETQYIHCLLGYIDGKQIDVSQLPPIPLAAEGKSMQRQVIQTGELLCIPDCEWELSRSQIFYHVPDNGSELQSSHRPQDNAYPRSAVMVPLKYQGRITGLLQVGSYRLNAYSEHDSRILEALTNQIVISLSNARLFADLAEERSLLELRVIERTAQLNHTKDRIETILNSSSDIIILCRVDGTIDQANPAFGYAFRYSSDEVYGQLLTHLFIPEHAVKLEEVFASVVKHRQPERLEIAAQCRDKESFEADVVISPIVQYDSQLIGVVCSLRDITERRKLEAQLRQMLEHEMELSELKSRYVSMAAHDLRNPLSAIQTTVQAIEKYYDRLTKEERQTRYESIHRNIGDMVDLLNDILIFGKAGSGKLAFEPDRLDMVRFAQDLVTELQQATSSGYRIKLSYSNTGNTAFMDAKLLRHILMNLLSNALKYSPPDSPVIFDIHSDAQYVTFHIQDQGIGIPSADQERLFEAFHRASNVGSTPGTGLGLAIVKQSVDLHGGTISFESREGEGTTFIVSFPQLPAHIERNT